MRGLIRKTLDKHLGHTCGTFEQTSFIEGSQSIFVNNYSAVRLNDSTLCTDRTAEGSDTVYSENKPISRTFDKTTGHGCFPPNYCIGGSEDVLTS